MDEPTATAELSGFMAELGPEARAAVRAVATPRTYRRGAALVHRGGLADRVLILLDGSVKVSYTSEQGKETVFAFHARGEIVGELSAIDGAPYSATVTAVEPVEALSMSAAAFRGLLEHDSGVASAVLRTITRRLRYADRQRVDFAVHDTVGRVARRLVELADRFGQPGEPGLQITLRLSQEELAGWTGSSREAVTKALHLLRELGWIKTDRRRITVLDVEALRRRAA
jgi:CRP-like cAMP-binding protein